MGKKMNDVWLKEEIFEAELVRQTNEWIKYVGDFPFACAEITSEKNIRRDVGRGTRHVLQIPIEHRGMRHVEVQRDVRDKIERVHTQLKMFADIGLFQMVLKTGGVELDDALVQFKICDGMLHVLIGKQSKIVMGELVYPEMGSLSPLIHCLRMIFVVPEFFANLEFELTAEDIARASVMTFELTLMPP